jgi:hypothetical protein
MTSGAARWRTPSQPWFNRQLEDAFFGGCFISVIHLIAGLITYGATGSFDFPIWAEMVIGLGGAAIYSSLQSR